MGKIEITSADGHVFDAYENQPDDAVAAIVVVQEIFGVNSHIRDVVDSYAAVGYHAVAPALFDRVERDVELDYTGEGVQAGLALRKGLETDDASADVAATVDYLASSGPVGVVGYCFGGSMAWLAASNPAVAAAVGYYGGQVRQFINTAPLAPVMLHFGGLDQSIPQEDVTAVSDAYPEIDVFVYPEADHGFNCDVRASYNADAAELARNRTLEFFSTHLSG